MDNKNIPSFEEFVNEKRHYSDLANMLNSLDETINERSNNNTTEVIELIQNDEFDINEIKEFRDSLYKSKRRGYLSEYSEEEFKDMTTYKVKGYDIGYAIKPDGDIVSVFNNSNVGGVGSELIKSAIRNGGTKLDHFDGWLSDFYEKLGFEEYMRYTWDDQYAPENWNYEKDGRPDVVFRKINK